MKLRKLVNRLLEEHPEALSVDHLMVLLASYVDGTLSEEDRDYCSKFISVQVIRRRPQRLKLLERASDLLLKEHPSSVSAEELAGLVASYVGGTPSEEDRDYCSNLISVEVKKRHLQRLESLEKASQHLLKENPFALSAEALQGSVAAYVEGPLSKEEYEYCSKSIAAGMQRRRTKKLNVAMWALVEEHMTPQSSQELLDLIAIYVNRFGFDRISEEEHEYCKRHIMARVGWGYQSQYDDER